MLLRTAGLIFGIDFYETNEIVCFAMQEIAQNLIQQAAMKFGRQPDEYQLKKVFTNCGLWCILKMSFKSIYLLFQERSQILFSFLYDFVSIQKRHLFVR